MLNKTSSLICYKDDEIFSVVEDGKKGEKQYRRFPEDFTLRGLFWSESFFLQDFFQRYIEEEEKYHERASIGEHRKHRKHRIHKIGRFIAAVDSCSNLTYDRETKLFVLKDLCP